MMQLSVEQYEAVIPTLKGRHIEALQNLYYLPNSSARAKQLAEIVHPSNPSHITATGLIGKMGKAIAEYWGIIPENYNDGTKERPAYFKLVSNQYDKEMGWTLHTNIKKALENLKIVGTQNDDYELLSTEISSFFEPKLFNEGKLIRTSVNRYERDRKARQACINHYGTKCDVCSFDFGSTYGPDIASGYIHVHHKKELSNIKGEYEVNPIADLIPLCANCHSAIHLTKPA